MRLVTFNANGIRSAVKRGFFEWAEGVGADVVCVQELKAQEADIPELIGRAGWHCVAGCAQKKGYSGCAIWSRKEPESVQVGIGSEEFDPEGRYVSVDIDGVRIASCYFPSGTMGDVRQAAKYRFLAEIHAWMDGLLRDCPKVVVCGDYNIAHKEIDIANWRGNLKHTGFLPEERAWIGELITTGGWVDVFRQLDPSPGRYTWWSQRGAARAKNVGWRIDYQMASPALAALARGTFITPSPIFSDHAPLTVDYALGEAA